MFEIHTLDYLLGAVGYTGRVEQRIILKATPRDLVSKELALSGFCKCAKSFCR
jgi:hypothetical protein